MANTAPLLEKEPRLDAQPLMDPHVFLIGRPPLKQWLGFVTDLAVGEGQRTYPRTGEAGSGMGGQA